MTTVKQQNATRNQTLPSTCIYTLQTVDWTSIFAFARYMHEMDAEILCWTLPFGEVLTAGNVTNKNKTKKKKTETWSTLARLTLFVFLFIINLWWNIFSSLQSFTQYKKLELYNKSTPGQSVLLLRMKEVCCALESLCLVNMAEST